MQCPRCQHDNLPAAKFCQECAAPLARPCTNCGSQLPLARSFVPSARTLLELWLRHKDSGARATVTYGFSEGGNVGNQCARASRPDEVHVALDVYAVIGRPTTPEADGWASLLMTAFRPACPKVLLNTEIGDLATFDTRGCDCAFGELGYVQHLHTIRSNQKLTGGGVTVLSADVQHVLEGILPARFGVGWATISCSNSRTRKACLAIP
jgi:hypothetical protein